MLSILLHKHLDEMDSIEEDIKIETDKIISGIDRKKLYEDPKGTMIEVINEIQAMMEEKFMPMASKNGFELAKAITKKDLIIDISKDPNKNEDVVK